MPVPNLLINAIHVNEEIAVKQHVTGTGMVDGTIISYKLQYQLSSIVRHGINGHGRYPMLLSPGVEGKWLRDLPRGWE